MREVAKLARLENRAKVAKLARLENRAKVALLIRMMKMIHHQKSKAITLSKLLNRNKIQKFLPTRL